MSWSLLTRGARSTNITTMKIVLTILCTLVIMVFSETEKFEAGKEVYVANSGYDYTGCGSQSIPCKTIRYAVNQTEPYSKVLVNGSSGPFTNEAGNSYIIIRHSLWLSAWTEQKVTIQCKNNASRLFQVIGEDLARPHMAPPCLTLSNIVIQGCHNSGFSATGVISLENAQLKLNNSDFTQNGLLMHHPQTSVNRSCSTIEVFIKECSFKNNYVARPFIYGISLLGCENITLVAEDSNFQSSPIAVKSTNGTKVHFTRIGFDGSGVKGSSVQITASPGDNGISFNRCNFTRHLSSKSSPATIFLESVPKGVSTVTFTDANFFGNLRQRTAGGALSVISRFRKPAQVDVRLDGCTFEGNSATDVGGAVNFAYVKLVHISGCLFRNNAGTNGGAISLVETWNATVANTVFENNSAITEIGSKTMANGGAIYVEKSGLQVTYSNFTNNTAVYSGSVVFATGCNRVLLAYSQLESSQNDGMISPQNQMLFISTLDSNSENATIWMVRNLFLVHGRHDRSVMFLKGKIHEKNNSVVCPDGQKSDYSILPPNYLPRYFDYLQLGAWCEACPYGKYGGVSHKEDLTPDGIEKEKNPCRPCPLNAVCEYGQIRAMPNYWGLVSNDSVEMYLCPRGQCCDDLASCTTYHSCRHDRDGTLCGECRSDSEKVISLGPAECAPSQHCWRPGVVAGFTVGFFVLFFLILASKYNLLKLYRSTDDDNRSTTETLLPENGAALEHQNISDTPATDRSESSDIQTAIDNGTNHLPAYCFSVVLLYQLSSIVYPRLTASGKIYDIVIHIIIEMFNFLPPVSVARICASKLFPTSLSSARLVFVLTYFWGLLFLPGIIFAVVFLLVRCCSKSDWQHKINRIQEQFHAYLIFLFIYSYVPLMRVGFEAVTCIQIHNYTFVIGDSTAKCYHTGQILAILYLILCVIPLFLVVEKCTKLLLLSSISWIAFVLFCFLPILGVVKLIWELVFSKCRPSRDDATSDLEPLEPSIRGRVFHAVVIGPFRSSVVLCVRINGLTVMLLRSLVLVAFGTLLSPWLLIQSVVLVVCCCLFLSHHLYAQWFVSSRVNRLESMHLILLVIFAAMNAYASVLYVLGQNEGEGSAGVILSICDWFCCVVLVLHLFYWIIISVFSAVRLSLKQRRQFHGITSTE